MTNPHLGAAVARSTALGALLIGSLGLTAARLFAQPVAAPRLSLGIETRAANGVQAGGVASVAIAQRGRLTLRLDGGAFGRLSYPDRTVQSIIAFRENDDRGADFVGSAGLTGEFYSRSTGGFVAFHTGATLIHWGPGTWNTQYPPFAAVNPEGSTTGVPYFGIGAGIEFAAMGGRNRFGIRVEHHGDKVADYRSFRLGVSRVW